MRYSSIEIPINDLDRAYYNDYEYVRNQTLRSTGGSLDKFITTHSEVDNNKKERKFTYEGRTEQGIARFKFTEEFKRQQAVEMDEIMFIPESHPLFNCYVITNKIHVKLFLNIAGSLPNYGYKLFQRDIRGCVLASIK